MRVASILGFWLGRVLLSALPVIAAYPAAAESVLTYHGHGNRSGTFTTPELTWEHARALRLDPGFAPRFEGHLYAQPLYWRPPGAQIPPPRPRVRHVITRCGSASGTPTTQPW